MLNRCVIGVAVLVMVVVLVIIRGDKGVASVVVAVVWSIDMPILLLSMIVDVIGNVVVPVIIIIAVVVDELSVVVAVWDVYIGDGVGVIDPGSI